MIPVDGITRLKLQVKGAADTAGEVGKGLAEMDHMSKRHLLTETFGSKRFRTNVCENQKNYNFIISITFNISN